MSFSFLHPLFLFGLAAGILPVLIHRLAQRKALLKKFSAVRLLLQSQRVMTRPQRLKNLSAPGMEGLKAAAFQRYFRLEGGGRSLLTFSNKDPLLSEGDLGKGKIFLFTSTADIDWNDLPLKGAIETRIVQYEEEQFENLHARKKELGPFLLLFLLLVLGFEMGMANRK
jgi:hypothetical protein